MSRPKYSEANSYDEIAPAYLKSDTKPDKQFSILPTVLDLIGDVRGKVCVDAGCGSGFFTTAIAKSGAKKVIGIDNSKEQIALANAHPHANIEYVQGDLFEDPLPANDVFVAPFALNFPRDAEELKIFIKKVAASLPQDGKLVAILDNPSGADLQRFGAKKFIDGPKIDGAPIIIELYAEDQKICILRSTYFSPETVERILKDASLSKITWHRPIISTEGLEKFGPEFWDGYLDNPELLYLVAEKSAF